MSNIFYDRLYDSGLDKSSMYSCPLGSRFSLAIHLATRAWKYIYNLDGFNV